MQFTSLRFVTLLLLAGLCVSDPSYGQSSAADVIPASEKANAAEASALEKTNWEKNLRSRARLGKILDLYYTDKDYKTLTTLSPDFKSLVLYIDGIAIPGLHPVGDYIHPKYNDIHILRYPLYHTDRIDPAVDAELTPDATIARGNARAWRLILRAEHKDRPLHVAIGTDKASDPKFRPLNRVGFEIFRGPWPWIAGAIILLLLGVLIIYGMWSNLLRDASQRRETEFIHSPPAWLAWLPGLNSPRTQGFPRPPFSLARVQMAIWLAIIVAAYLFIWLVADDKNNFNKTALILLGISLATGLVARSIDAGKGGDATRLQIEKAQLETKQDQIASIDVGTRTPEQVKELASAEKRLAEIMQKLSDNTVPSADHKSEGFLTDILSDENGVSLQRLQMLGWTLVLALIFAADVWSKLSMPDFNTTLLGLMGISAGTYIGFKVPEKKTISGPPSE